MRNNHVLSKLRKSDQRQHQVLSELRRSGRTEFGSGKRSAEYLSAADLPAAERLSDLPAELSAGSCGAYRAPIKKRNIALCIIFSIITFGIYGIYWQICIVNDLNTASGRTQDTSGGVVFLLSLVTCSIYGLYWLYTAGNKVNIIKQRNGMVADGNNGLIYLLLALFSAGIISYCLIQSELNNVATLE